MQIEVEGGGFALDREDLDAAQMHILPVPIEGVPGQKDAIPDLPVFEQKGTVGNEVPGPVPLGIAFHALPVDGKEGVKPREVQEEGGGMDELHDQGMGIPDSDPDFVEVLGLSLVEILRSHDEAEQLGVLGPRHRGQKAMPTPTKVLGCKRVSIAPLGVLADVEDIGPPVLGDLPGLRHAGERSQVLRIGNRKPLEKVPEDVALGDSRDDRWIQALGLGGVDEDEIRAPLSSLPEGQDRSQDEEQAQQEGEGVSDAISFHSRRE